MTSLVGWLFKYTESPYTPKTNFQLTLFSKWITNSLNFLGLQSQYFIKTILIDHVICAIIGIP